MKACRKLPGILAAAIALAAVLPAAASVNAPGGQAMAATVRSASASDRPVTLSLDDSDSIASFFLSLAKDPAKNFIMDKIGLETTSSQLRELSAKLDAIQQQLTAFQTQVTALIAQLSLTTAVLEANRAVGGLPTFYRDHFAVLGTDLVNLKAAQEATPPNPARVATAMAQYATDKQAFITSADALNLNGRIDAIHKAFEPGAGATGLMRAVGESLLAKKQYLTRTDSDNERSIYVYYEENQALAGWLTCEWEIARGHAELVPTVVKEFTDDVAAQRNPGTPNGVPPLLPAGTLLDRGTDPSKITNSRNKLLFTDTRVKDAAWSPGSANVPRVPDVVGEFNAARWAGFSDWIVPSQGEVAGLFNGLGPVRDRMTISDYLSSLDLAESGVGPFIWTRDSVIRRIAFDNLRHEQLDFRVYEGISTSNLAPDERPRLNSSYVDPAEVYDAFNNARGSVFLVRNTGETRYF